ncbi:pyrimidine/purine nucleoside phosphorylase [Acinetobacter sp. WCHAc060025]|uniref:pyrimidine/purine nucleoside phosphorylase n=1 Tax=Acinetobacter sp. WCHAc060025 TaxID=2518625 RepID=UPI001023C4DE|nr:pyrimidine/purine nucleoside phosphorylase [Acinetobacter sp. WCHAc060025]RZG76695.1 pyrimidine/purine nucleoside phosphorylase [Acinetobacter sp. WCHAc060025]
MAIQFDFVTVHKKPNIHFDGRSISYLIECQDGSKKTLGVLLPTEKPLTFETHVPERIEIISGKCLIKIEDGEFKSFSAGEYFKVPENSRFSMQSSEVVDYVCHLE